MAHWFEWWMTPLSGAIGHHLAGPLAWHGRLMVLGWGLAIPLAMLIARFFKVTRKQRWPQELDNTFWWHGHRSLVLAAVVATLSALASVCLWAPAAPPRLAASWHALLGWCVVGLLALQVLSGLLRGSKGGPTAPRRAPDGQELDLHGDHYDMTPRRYLFERVHKLAGYLVLLVAWAAMFSGLWLADAPRWMPAALVLAGFVFVLAFVRWQRAGRCVDTYQAIWGPDLAHPGNSMKVTGWGVRRMRGG
jgi:hypothetical protein